MTPKLQQSTQLMAFSHGFFGRDGGVSSGIYRSLNTGPGSLDKPDAIRTNRARVQQTLEAEYLVTGYQTHSDIALFVDAPWPKGEDIPEADALVTTTPGLAIGVMTADCVPVLFGAPGLIAAAHAGWKGSLGGIIEATVKLIKSKKVKPKDLCVAIGPCLRAPAFEVGDDLIEQVVGKYPAAERFFTPAPQQGKAIYDHVGFVRWRLEKSGIPAAQIDDVGGCTLSAPDTYFSYRASRYANEPDYGRNLSVIALPKG